jgi:hypothetical protein
MEKAISYYEIIPEHSEYKGKRYFKVTEGSLELIQVVAEPGYHRRGKASIGIYEIMRVSFYNNYLVYATYVQECSKETFEKEFKEVLAYLKNEL